MAAMRRLAVCALLALIPFAAVDAAGDTRARSGVSGQVLMDACPAPGANCVRVPATVQIRRAGSGRFVRTVRARDGRFHARLRPGRYRLTATADNGNGAGTARVRVKRHRLTSIVIYLHSPAM